MKAILERRSIRKYTGKEVSDKIIKDLLKAGMSAPSAGNGRPWHFIVIKDRKILTDITKIHQYSKMLENAPVAIVVSADLNLEKYKGYWVQDCSAATENILIGVEEKGLGAVWLGVYPEKDRVDNLKQLLNMPENVVPLSIISIGYPAEEKKVIDRYDETRVHYNRW